MSNLATHEAEQAALTAAYEARHKPRTNMDRAKEGRELCDRMQSMTGVDELAFQVTDALCQLMHLCRLIRDEDGEPIDFDEQLETARINFAAECDEDPDQ